MATNILYEYDKELSGVSGSHKSVETLGVSELEKWSGRKETDPNMYSTLKEYWDYVQFGDNWSPSGTPWSSAFVSYILKGSGFPKRAAHRLYIEDIMQGKNPTWGAYSIAKTDELQLNVGDVLIKPRSADYNATHGDVVYKIENGKAYLVGGNLSNTAKVGAIFDVDEEGFVKESVSPYMIILKKKGSESRVNPLLILGVVSLIAVGVVINR